MVFYRRILIRFQFGQSVLCTERSVCINNDQTVNVMLEGCRVVITYSSTVCLDFLSVHLANISARSEEIKKLQNLAKLGENSLFCARRVGRKNVNRNFIRF